MVSGGGTKSGYGKKRSLGFWVKTPEEKRGEQKNGL